MKRTTLVATGLAVLVLAAGCTSKSSSAPPTAATTSSSLGINTDPDLGPSSVAANSSISSGYASSVSSARSTASSTPTSTSAPTSAPHSSAPVSTSGPSSAPTTPAAQRFSWTVGPTAPKTADAVADIAAAEPIYQGYMATYDDSFRAPHAKDWQPVMANYAADRALTTWRTGWQGNVQYGLSQKGTMTAAARVEGAGRTPAGLDVVSVRACMDLSHTDTVDGAGNPVPMGTGLPTKNFAWLLTFEKINGQMRVVDLVVKTPTGKTLPC